MSSLILWPHFDVHLIAVMQSSCQCKVKNNNIYKLGSLLFLQMHDKKQHGRGRKQDKSLIHLQPDLIGH